MIDISVIILNYNTFKLTCECIASIYQQTQGVSFEIIVVDNSSSECDPDLIKQAFPNIKLIKNSINIGFAKGNNSGLQYASGKTILLLNSDTKLLNNALFLAYAKLNESKSVAAVTGKLIYPNGRIQYVAQRFPSMKLILLEIFRFYHFMSHQKRQHVFLSNYFDHKEEVFADWIWATFFLIKREIIDLFPESKFHEDFFMYEEDKLWCYFLYKKGFKVLFTPKPLILHYMTSSSKNLEDSLIKSNYIVHNEFNFLKITRGIYYAKTYFFLKYIHYLTSNYYLARPLAKLYLKFVLRSTHD